MHSQAAADFFEGCVLTEEVCYLHVSKLPISGKPKRSVASSPHSAVSEVL
jgi:hypothetical protein